MTKKTKISYKNALERAKLLLKDKNRTKNLLNESKSYLDDKTKISKKLREVKGEILLIIRLLKAYVKGDYRQIKVKNVIALLGVIIYLATPTDLFPDFIPLSGFIDDATLIVWVFNNLREELQQFESWESNHSEIE